MIEDRIELIREVVKEIKSNVQVSWEARALTTSCIRAVELINTIPSFTLYPFL
jgi:hypothetical protein